MKVVQHCCECPNRPALAATASLGCLVTAFAVATLVGSLMPFQSGPLEYLSSVGVIPSALILSVGGVLLLGGLTPMAVRWVRRCCIFFNQISPSKLWKSEIQAQSAEWVQKHRGEIEAIQVAHLTETQFTHFFDAALPEELITAYVQRLHPAKTLEASLQACSQAQLQQLPASWIANHIQYVSSKQVPNLSVEQLPFDQLSSVQIDALSDGQVESLSREQLGRLTAPCVAKRPQHWVNAHVEHLEASFLTEEQRAGLSIPSLSKDWIAQHADLLSSSQLLQLSEAQLSAIPIAALSDDQLQALIPTANDAFFDARFRIGAMLKGNRVLELFQRLTLEQLNIVDIGLLGDELEQVLEALDGSRLKVLVQKLHSKELTALMTDPTPLREKMLPMATNAQLERLEVGAILDIPALINVLKEEQLAVMMPKFKGEQRKALLQGADKKHLAHLVPHLIDTDLPNLTDAMLRSMDLNLFTVQQLRFLFRDPNRFASVLKDSPKGELLLKLMQAGYQPNGAPESDPRRAK